MTFAVSIDQIKRCVALHYGIPREALVARSRERRFARPRQVAMYLARRLTNRSYGEIAQQFGKRDHTTIMHGCKLVDHLRTVDERISYAVDSIAAYLRPDRIAP